MLQSVKHFIFIDIIACYFSFLELLEKVFLRIALAESDDKLEASLNNFLAPTLLKLASRDEEVKNKVNKWQTIWCQ